MTTFTEIFQICLVWTNFIPGFGMVGTGNYMFMLDQMYCSLFSSYIDTRILFFLNVFFMFTYKEMIKIIIV